MIGKVLHFAVKAEWQTRCSEHAHMLFWCKDVLPSLELEECQEDGTLKLVRNDLLKEFAERYISAWAPEIDNLNNNKDMTFTENIARVIQHDPITDLASVLKNTEQKSHAKI